jgi:aspartate 1-decarboxylase
MRRALLKSKIHRATVTDADLDYEGSISIDPVLALAADLVPFERHRPRLVYVDAQNQILSTSTAVA